MEKLHQKLLNVRLVRLKLRDKISRTLLVVLEVIIFITLCPNSAFFVFVFLVFLVPNYPNYWLPFLCRFEKLEQGKGEAR